MTARTLTRGNGKWLDEQQFPAVHWIIRGIIPEGLTLLVAPPKAGKSWLVYALALARAMGGQVLGQQITQGPVLYLALEDGFRRLQDRGRTLLAPGESLPENLEYIIRFEADEIVTEVIRKWINVHKGENPLVVIDTLGRVKPSAKPGASAYEHDYAVIGALKRLVDDEPGSAMVLVHHDRKAASEDFVDAVSGTNGIAGAADTTVVIRRARTEGDAVLSVTGREVAEAEYAATFNAGHWSLTGGTLGAARKQVVTAKASAGLGDRSARIVRLVSDQPKGVRARDIAQAEEISQSNAGEYLRRLADAGRLASPERGLYTPVESVESVESVEVVDQSDSTLSTQFTATHCEVCGDPLHPAVAAGGFTTHPTCDEVA